MLVDRDEPGNDGIMEIRSYKCELYGKVVCGHLKVERKSLG